MAVASELRVLTPGEALDRAVERSLIQPYPGTPPMAPYSTDPITALALVEMVAPRWEAEVTIRRNRDGSWECEIEGDIEGGFSCEGRGGTMAEAICKAVAEEMEQVDA